MWILLLCYLYLIFSWLFKVIFEYRELVERYTITQGTQPSALWQPERWNGGVGGRFKSREICILMTDSSFPGGSDGKEWAHIAGDLVQSLDGEDPLGEENGNPLQYSCLKNSVDRGAWWATVHGSQRFGYDWETSTHTQVIHPAAWQKPPQHCKAVIL